MYGVEGNRVADNVSGRTVRRAAQRIADRLGRSVWAYCDSADADREDVDEAVVEFSPRAQVECAPCLSRESAREKLGGGGL